VVWIFFRVDIFVVFFSHCVCIRLPGCNRHRLLIDVITTVPFDAIVIGARAGSLSDINARYVALLGILKLGRMYRVGVMFRNMSYNLNLGLLALTLLRNFTVRAWL
jgi:hypothetical protein